MKFWVGVTDNTWLNFLSARGLNEATFFCQTSATPPFLNAPIGMPFPFKLKRPNIHIAGEGFFVTYTSFPVSLAWEIFGEKNGAATLDDLRSMLDPLSKHRELVDTIGCTVLANPFFFSQDRWIADPPGWAGSIVRGKAYHSLNNQPLSVLPDLPAHRQDPDRLGWHYKNRFQA